ncbi:MAG: hypothetical protein VB124_03585 [Burkholderia sp.]
MYIGLASSSCSIYATTPPDRKIVSKQPDPVHRSLSSPCRLRCRPGRRPPSCPRFSPIPHDRI